MKICVAIFSSIFVGIAAIAHIGWISVNLGRVCLRKCQRHQAAVESLPREHAQIEAFTPTKKWSVVPQGPFLTGADFGG